MSIPESQLETWSHQGSITQSSDTYHSIKTILGATDVPYAGKNYEIFLQGSYGNATNIYSESDVDIVIKLNNCFQHDLTKLATDQQEAFKESHSPSVRGALRTPTERSMVITEERWTQASTGSD